MEPLSVKDMIEFFNKLQISGMCSQCEHPISFVPSQLTNKPNQETEYSFDELVELTPIRATTPDGKIKFYDAVPVVCERCGYVRTFLTQNIYNTLSKVYDNE